jgi:hypothetical protein
MVKKPGRGSEQFVLRLPEGMRDQIKASAEDSGRSMNQEIITVLEEYFPSPPTDDEIIHDIKHILSLDPDLTASMNRHNLQAALTALLERFMPIDGSRLRKEPYIILSKDTLDRLDSFIEQSKFGNRDDAADNLIKMSLNRIESHQAGIVDDFGKNSESDLEKF